MEAALGRAVSATRCWAAGDLVADTPPQGRVQQSETEKQTAGCLPIKFFSNLDHRKYYYSDAPEERTEPRLVRSQGDKETEGFDPWVGKIPWRRKWPPTPVFLPGESHGQRSLVG
ncbi:hypothetical protein R6Z07F_015941 [Ovis aries]